MAEVAKLLFLLVALINGLHGGNVNENKRTGDVLIFPPPQDAEFCVISRSIGAENLVLWNTSDPSAERPGLPEDLKKRLEDRLSLIYVIHNLTHSDGGLYREECWTDGVVTHQKNITVTVCDVISDHSFLLNVGTGETVSLPCEGAGTNLTIQWFRSEDLILNSPWTRLFVDDNGSLNPLMKHMEGRVQLMGNESSLQISVLTRGDIVGPSYYCLIMDGQQCVRSNRVIMFPKSEYVYHSVGEEAVLPCFDSDLYGPPTHWQRNHVEKLKTFPVLPLKNHSEISGELTDQGQQDRTSDDPVVNINNSLVFPSLTLFHNGVSYECANDQYMRSYFLLVCPESAPHTQMFSEGEKVTLRCDYRPSEGMRTVWVRLDGATIGPYSPNEENPQMDEGFKGRVKVNVSSSNLVLSNLSSEDSGEYRCVVYNVKCVSTTKNFLIYKSPSGTDFNFYALWSLVVSFLLGMICAVVMQVRRRGQPRHHLVI